MMFKCGTVKMVVDEHAPWFCWYACFTRCDKLLLISDFANFVFVLFVMWQLTVFRKMLMTFLVISWWVGTVNSQKCMNWLNVTLVCWQYVEDLRASTGSAMWDHYEIKNKSHVDISNVGEYFITAIETLLISQRRMHVKVSWSVCMVTTG